MVTMKDIAQNCGVSKGLVSRIVNNDKTLSVSDEMRQKVLNEIEKTGYSRNINAMVLAGKRKVQSCNFHKIGYITFSSKSHLGHPYFSHIIDGILDEMSKINCSPVFSVPIDEFKKKINMYIDKYKEDNQLDGLILLGRIDDSELKKAIKKISKYVVCMDGLFDKQSDYVGVNFNDSINLALKHIISMGYTDIGLLCSTSIEDRLAYCEKVMSENGLEFNPEWIINGEYNIDISYRRTKENLMNHKPPKAIVAWNDEMAVGCIKALKEQNYQIPDDVAITGHDDISIAAYFDVPLTTVRIYKEEIGRLALKMLVDRIESKRVNPIMLEAPGKLIIRDSCGYKKMNKNKQTE